MYLEKLKEYQKEIFDLQHIINIIEWDLKISTPEDEKDEVIKLIGTLEDKLFKLENSKDHEKVLKDAINSDEFKKLEDNEQRYIKALLKKYQKIANVPNEFYVKYTEFVHKSTMIWEKAKANNNYEEFKPILAKIIELTKEYYSYINSGKNLYDVMLEDYEPNLTSEVIDDLFGKLKEKILPLIPHEIKEVPFVKINSSESDILKCAEFLLDYIGFDMNKGALGIYPHGYTEKMGPNDIRIAIRNSNDPIDFVSTIIHEGGHGIFEQNIKENLSQYENTTVDNLYALHESQSRFYENILGRNKNFWIPIYDDVRKLLRLDVDIDEFVSMLNTPKCGSIRVNADELTYCMHIILRYEIERDLFNGSLTVDEIPEVWKKKTHEYLNVDVASDSEGLMQDVHWSEGNFGYFPSYLMGSIYDGMFLEKIEQDLGSIDDILREGRIGEITNYLISNIYKNGGAYTSLEIIDKMCGKELSAEPLVNYFQSKYDHTLVKKRK